MARHLLQDVIESGLDGRGRDWSFALGRHLAGRQAQVQRHYSSFPRRIFLNHSLEMDELGTKRLQAFAQFFYLGVYFLFDVGSFANFIANMNVHESLGCR